MAGAVEEDIIFGQNGFLGPYNKDSVGPKFTSRQFTPNIEKLITSIIAYAQYKAMLYKQNTPAKDLDEAIQNLAAKQKILADRRSKNEGILTKEGLDKVAEQAMSGALKSYAVITDNLAKFQSKETANREIVETYCKYLTLKDAEKLAFRETLGSKIADSILNLRSEVSGESTNAKATRRQIEQYVIDFANSWRSFQGSYILNYCLTGGAGVGKTTLAKAISKCFASFGILATDYVKEASKTDFIGEYIGQTVARTQDVLYRSLEGVCFIDEAYAVGQVESFGQEFLDEITFFTQKFPGCICIIVAGYEKEMQTHFFSKNEGLNRRFPNRVDLKPYDITTIKNTLVSRVIKKLMIPMENQEQVKQALRFHMKLLQLLYMDMQETGISYLTALNEEEIYGFNFAPVFMALYFGTNSPEKRNILKTYILKRWLNIPEGDLFPNQMGDIQNIVDFVLRLQPVLEAGSITLQDAINTMNSYFNIRSSLKLSIKEDTMNRAVLYMTLPKQSNEEFQRVILGPLLQRIFSETDARVIDRYGHGYPANAALEPILKRNLNQLYTEAVLYLQNYQTLVAEGKQTVKLSTHVDTKFLTTEAEEIGRKRLENANALLEYESHAVSASEFDSSAYATGAFPVAPRETLESVCKTVVKIPKEADVRNADDGAGVPPASLGPVGAGVDPPPVAPRATRINSSTYRGFGPTQPNNPNVPVPEPPAPASSESLTGNLSLDLQNSLFVFEKGIYSMSQNGVTKYFPVLVALRRSEQSPYWRMQSTSPNEDVYLYSYISGVAVAEATLLKSRGARGDAQLEIQIDREYTLPVQTRFVEGVAAEWLASNHGSTNSREVRDYLTARPAPTGAPAGGRRKQTRKAFKKKQRKTRVRKH